MTYDPLGAVEGVNQPANQFLATVTTVPTTYSPSTDWRLVGIVVFILIVVTTAIVVRSPASPCRHSAIVAMRALTPIARPRDSMTSMSVSAQIRRTPTYPMRRCG